MSDKTGIEWTDATWNPVTGCTEVSPGCDHCYAKTFAERWRGTEGHYFEHGFDVQLRPDKLDQPLRWKKPRKIFVNSMSDLFHDSVPDDYIAQVFAIMAMASQHTFQVLTKRHARMRSLLSSTEFWTQVGAHGRGIAFERAAGRYPASGPMALTADSSAWGHWTAAQPLPNVWLGVSTENQQWADIRIPALLDTPAAVRFVSAEPLLGWLELTDDLLYRPTPCPDGCPCVRPQDADRNDCACGGPCCMSYEWNDRKPDLHWVITGGESGRGARPAHPDWFREIRNRCQSEGIAYLHKQHGEWVPERMLLHANNAPAAFLSDDGRTRLLVNGKPTAPPMSRGDDITMRRVGKKAAGRELDGRTWDQYPTGVTADA
jgi:protein gp37